MLGDEFGPDYDPLPRRKRRRRKVQKRTLPRHDLWDPVENGMTRAAARVRQSNNRREERVSVGRSAFLLLTVLGALLAGWWLWEGMSDRSGGLRLRQLVVETGGLVSEAEVAEVSGARPGMRLSESDIRAIRRRLGAIPGVRDIVVARQQPDTLILRVKERVPLAWLSCPDQGIAPLRRGGFLVDADRVAIPAGEMSDRLAHLPVIVVEGIPAPAAGTVIHSGLIERSLRLIEASEILFTGKGMDIVEMRDFSEWGLLCRYQDDLTVVFHADRIEKGLRDLDEIVKKTRKLKVPLASVNLAVAKNIPVTFHTEIDPEKWQNLSDDRSEQTVPEGKLIQEKHLRSILRGG